MASGSDSEGSVFVVEHGPDEKGATGEAEANSARVRRNFCMERNGVPQPRPKMTRTKPSMDSAGGSSVSTEFYPPEHSAKRRSSRCPPQKRARISCRTDTDADSVVVDVEKTDNAVVASHGQISKLAQQGVRHSARLREKKAMDKIKETEYNPLQHIRDRKRRESRREAGQSTVDILEKSIPAHGVSSIEVLDDDEDKQHPAPTDRENDPIERSEQRKRSTVDQKGSPHRSRIDDEVVPVDDEEEACMEEEENGEENQNRRSRDSNALDAPYTGSTHLIFEFPPGKRGKIRVTEEERGRLSQRKYLNDSLIDFYIKYHESDLERRAEGLRFSTTFFSSFFFGRLRRIDPIDYDGVKGWTKKVDIFEKQFVFVPICDSYHWSLIIVANLDKVEGWVSRKEEFSQLSPEAPRIIYLDSLDPKRGTEFGETMRQYLVEEWLAKKTNLSNRASRKATAATFKKVIPILSPDVPIQTNEYDCGLYLLNSFERFLYNMDGLRDKLLSGYRDVRDAYSHVEITILRKSIINLMDILERQWTNEQSPPDGGSSKGVPEDSKASAVENHTTGTEKQVSGSTDQAAAVVDNLMLTEKDAVKMSRQKAPSPSEIRAFEQHDTNADREEKNASRNDLYSEYEQQGSPLEQAVSGESELADDAGDREADETADRAADEAGDRAGDEAGDEADDEEAGDQDDLDSDHLSIDSPTYQHSEQRNRGPDISIPDQDEEYAFHGSVERKLTSRLDESSDVIQIPTEPAGLLSHRDRDEESNRDTSDCHEDEDEPVEVPIHGSPPRASRQKQNGFGGSRFSGQRSGSAKNVAFD